MDWFRMYHEFASDPKIQGMTEAAKHLSLLAHQMADEKRTCYPNWRDVEQKSGFSRDEFMAAFDEMCDVGLVFSGFPSLLVALAERYPLAPMFGPIGSNRPSASIWNRLRAIIFKRDDFTCAYCGERGGRLECDHIVPVSRGGHHGEDNLVTACFACNRSKRDKLVGEWKGK